MKRHCSPGKSILVHHTVVFTLILTHGPFCSGITYYPPKYWATLLPTLLVSAFFAAPLVYAACNIFATPKVDSIYTIWDEHSRQQNVESDGYANESPMSDRCIVRSIVPEICDLDVATINALVESNETLDTVDGM